MRRLLNLPFLLLLGGCQALPAVDSLLPKDEGSELIARDIAFAEGERGRLDVYAPVAPAKDPLPVIVFIYGGSWSSGLKDGYGFAGRALAAQGFITVIPDYRLVPQVRFPAFLEDNAAAVRWVRANIAKHGGDPERIVLVGHSAGAYNAAMLALDPRWLGAERAAVKGFAGLSGPYDFLPLDHAVTKAAFGQADDKAATQPINLASADDPPTLLLVGAKDETVSPQQSRRLAKALTDTGASAEVRVYPDTAHVGMVMALARPFRGRAPVLKDVAQFARQVTHRSGGE